MNGIATFDLTTEKGKKEHQEFLKQTDRIILDEYYTKNHVYIQYKTTYKSKLYPNQ